MPMIIEKGDAKDEIRAWLREHRGFSNPNVVVCCCGKYRIKYESTCLEVCDHFAHTEKHRCGGRVTSSGKPYLCEGATAEVFHTIDDIAVEGECPKCRAILKKRLKDEEARRRREERQRFELERPAREQAERERQASLAQEQADLFEEARLGMEARRRRGM
ncbi:hypothetical protein HD806DRAFT_549737 [Xylariaceae sp. AK1471]|nr:hypothetical protein HD806DRAFT_549737 [Xylariaceae sp. AK1471]